MALIEYKNVEKYYGDYHALRHINLEIEKGQVVVLLGPSGSGKSTLIRTMNALESIETGSLKVNGHEVSNASNKELVQLRKEVGMVFQHFNLYPHKTVLENVTLAPVKVLGMDQKEAEKIAEKYLTYVNMWDRKDSYPGMLSGGQKQRVAIARALANDPKILISDESTSALDPKTTKQILALLQDLNKKLGLTVVMITHEMQIVKEICNRVAVMQKGSLIEEGSTLEIFSNPKQPLTQDFIKTATGIDEALVKINRQEVVEHLGVNDRLVLLRYAGAATDEPLLNSLYKNYEVSANILYANIEILEDTPVGEMVVVLSGQQVDTALQVIEKAEVSVTILKGGSK